MTETQDGSASPGADSPVSRRKLILILILLTPGIPEYLTGSSKFSTLFFNPPSFFIGIIFNICLYTAGVLLIREFAVRLRKGWASILTLGCAYGIMEEGIAVHTFFKIGQPAANLSIYGRFAGVNWVWVFAITIFHAAFSVALPILLLKLAYPQKANRPLLGKRGIVTVFLIYVTDVIVLNTVVAAKPAEIYYVLFLGAVLFLILIAWKLPADLLTARGKPGIKARRVFVGGLLMFLTYVFYSMIVGGTNGFGTVSPTLDILFLVISYILLAFYISTGIPKEQNARHIFILCVGAVIPLMFFALILQVSGGAPLIVVPVLIAIVLLMKLREKLKLQARTPITSAR